MSRALAYSVGLGVLVAVVSPAFQAKPEDSYPLSTYPMFSQRRTAPVLYFAEGIDAAGKRSRVPPELIANDEVMQAAAVVRRAVLDGEDASARLCARVAEQARRTESHRALARIELVSAKFDPVGYFVGSGEPLERTTHFGCDVEGAQ
jgi:hypothetical protein